MTSRIMVVGDCRVCVVRSSAQAQLLTLPSYVLVRVFVASVFPSGCTRSCVPIYPLDDACLSCVVAPLFEPPLRPRPPRRWSSALSAPSANTSRTRRWPGASTLSSVTRRRPRVWPPSRRKKRRCVVCAFFFSSRCPRPRCSTRARHTHPVRDQRTRHGVTLCSRPGCAPVPSWGLSVILPWRSSVYEPTRSNPNPLGRDVQVVASHHPGWSGPLSPRT